MLEVLLLGDFLDLPNWNHLEHRRLAFILIEHLKISLRGRRRFRLLGGCCGVTISHPPLAPRKALWSSCGLRDITFLQACQEGHMVIGRVILSLDLSKLLNF